MSSHNESTSESENPKSTGGSKPGCCDGGGEASGSPHAPVSSEGGGEGTAGRVGTVVDQVAESFDGYEIGELESIPGFNPQRALNEGMPTEILTDELLDLGECRPEGFPPETVSRYKPQGVMSRWHSMRTQSSSVLGYVSTQVRYDLDKGYE